MDLSGSTCEDGSLFGKCGPGNRSVTGRQSRVSQILGLRFDPAGHDSPRTSHFDLFTEITAYIKGVKMTFSPSHPVLLSAATTLVLVATGPFSARAETETPPPVIPLHDRATTKQPDTTLHTPDALITRIADRVRDRHAREPGGYDHYLSWYWEERTVTIELIDKVAKGGQELVVNITSLAPLNKPDFRCFFRGINTAAEYHHNVATRRVATNRYTTTITFNNLTRQPLAMGDRMEFEFSPFLVAPKNGRKNYYGTAFLYVIGQGLSPWQATGERQQSTPLPTSSWLGGHTTLSYQYSSEPTERFKQMAGNMAPANAQAFMLGRRLHHTDFGNGTHSEQPNPGLPRHAGKLGPKFVARSCIACHVNNGRAIPPAVDSPMYQTVLKVGADDRGTPHPQLGTAIQPQAIDTTPEATATISSYHEITGQFADGMRFSLRKPIYTFTGHTPEHFSARLTPQLVGLGLLEAIDESTIIQLADPGDADQDGISGRIQIIPDPETGQRRLGRFGYKAGQARLRHQVAAAFNSDMGITTPLFPRLDGQSVDGPIEVTTPELDQLTRYLSTLGVSARRNLNDPIAQRGERLFARAGCAKCHTMHLKTGPFHPLAELRNQSIQPYSDLLLHDMGPGLADTLGEHRASGAEWRTAPLWSLGLTAGISGHEAYLHDGRARTITEAILWHGGEAANSRTAFLKLPASDRTALTRFLKSL